MNDNVLFFNNILNGKSEVDKETNTIFKIVEEIAKTGPCMFLNMNSLIEYTTSIAIPQEVINIIDTVCKEENVDKKKVELSFFSLMINNGLADQIIKNNLDSKYTEEGVIDENVDG